MSAAPLIHDFAAYLHTYGAVALFVTILLEAAGLPMPGESALVSSVVLAMSGQLQLSHVFVAALAGAIVGDNIGYAAGRYAGRGAIVRVSGRFGVTNERLKQTEGLLRRWGPWLIVIARFFPVLRQIGGLGAGSIGMSWPRFLAANAAGAFAWVSMWVATVWILDPLVPELARAWDGSLGHKMLIVVSALVLLGVVALVARKLLRSIAG
ncbi:MAG: DedA family protein [Hyphomicrobiaceae bacterium]|nr:DedA family protein [Hyphomicrobiaceae bacterium]